MTAKRTNESTFEVDPENPPTVDGVIVADDIGKLLQVIGDEDNPDPNRPFCLFGKDGTFHAHGYTRDEDLIGKRCLIYSGGRFDMVAIEPPSGNHWGIVIWCEYV